MNERPWQFVLLSTEEQHAFMQRFAEAEHRLCLHDDVSDFAFSQVPRPARPARPPAAQEDP